MKIYADILFFINFIMDFLLIKQTALLMSEKIKPIRAVLSAFTGAVMGVCFFACDFGFAGSFIPSLVICGAVTGVGFLPCRKKDFFIRLGVMYLSSAFFGGAVFLGMNLFGGGIIKNGIFYAKLPAVALGGIAVYTVTRIWVWGLKRKVSTSFSKVVLEYKGKRVRSDAMTDTGNGLTEPVSGRPVMIIEAGILKELVGKECVPGNLYEWVENERIRIIPYSTVDGDGSFVGLVLDRAYIDGRRIDKAIAAVCENKLKYPVILHAGM